MATHYLNHGSNSWAVPQTPLSGPFFDPHTDSALQGDFGIFGNALSPMQLSNHAFPIGSPPATMHHHNKNYPTSRDWSPLAGHEDFGLADEFTFSDLNSPEANAWKSAGIAGRNVFGTSSSSSSSVAAVATTANESNAGGRARLGSYDMCFALFIVFVSCVSYVGIRAPNRVQISVT
jgi:hypothetical protein